ncbi:MAG: polyprenyl synthetase family protein [Anaerolineales bacterium]|nr:polyprenyl synthetase family protein [Anaerolineales bacterium]MDW8161036.1 polyprenyl synthetase family protein [Anaerolineales bacterium]
MNPPQTFLTPILSDLSKVESRMRALDTRHHRELANALEHLLSSGGKRIRPAVALLTGKMYRGDIQRLISLSAAIELLHTATLVHDDLIDGALLRRGIATLNAKWSPAATVLTGDYIFAQAALCAAETDSVYLMKQFAKTLGIIVNGEIDQLFSTHRYSTREEYFQRIYAKTASLFELASSAAAHLSGVSEDEVECMRRFGYALGMAFQIVDDILDFTGVQETMGKPVANDLRQGLITLPFICYLEKHPEDEEVQAVLSGEKANIDKLVSEIRASGAVQDAFQIARDYVREAVSILEGRPACVERRALIELSEYVIMRHI